MKYSKYITHLRLLSIISSLFTHFVQYSSNFTNNININVACTLNMETTVVLTVMGSVKRSIFDFCSIISSFVISEFKMSVKKIKVISDEEINRALDTFSDLGLSQWLCDTCALLGMHTPTPIQKKCIPAILNGKYRANEYVIVQGRM